MQKNIRTLLLLFTLGISTLGTAQRESDQRTLTTKVADLLAELPAEGPEQFRMSMNHLGAMGKEGLLALSDMLVPTENGDNTKLEYAIGGFSYFVTQPGMEDWRRMSVEAYCQALGRVDNVWNKAFLIRQLEMVGQNDAVACLKDFLSKETLCAPAAKALVNINTLNANQALLQALKTSNGACRLSLVHSLGDVKSKEAVAAIAPLVKSGDSKLRKMALYALANIGDPGSQSILKEAAKKDNFTYGNENATSAYLLYAQRLADNGQNEEAEGIAKSLLNKKEDQQVHTRTAALQLLTGIQGEKSLPLLLDAAGEKNPEYRAAALKFAAVHVNFSTTEKWVKKMKRAGPEVKAAIITMLGENEAESALPAMLKELRNRKDQVKLAAIGAVGRLGGKEALAELLRVGRKANEQELAALKNALLIMDADGLTDEIANALPKMPKEAQANLISVLGSRAASHRIKDVFSYVEDRNENVRVAALAALEQMATKENLPRLFSVLKNNSRPEEVSMIQDAVVAAVNDYDDQSQQVSVVLEQMESAPSGKKPRYYNILSRVGGEKALQAVSDAFDSGDDVAKEAAVQALVGWSDVSAANELYKISKSDQNENYKSVAINGYIRAISQSEYPGEQKLLLLRRAMDLVGVQHKQLILREVGKTGSFPALVFSGKFLDEPLLQQEAARSVMNITLNNEFYGDVVRKLLKKSLDVLQGPDSEYQKNAMHKFLEEMPEGEGFVQLFNGEDLSGWKGLVANPIERAKMDEQTLNDLQEKADRDMRESWIVQDGELIFTGEGHNIATQKKYGDFEMFVDWKIYDEGHKNGDAGIYLRGTPQVQIWDTSRVEDGAQVGSGGLYNNKINPTDPLQVADNPLGQWNNFHIIMKGDRVTVYLNGKLVTDNVILENYWDRGLPIFPEEQIELQAHCSRVAYRDIYIRELPRTEPFELSEAEKKEGFEVLFDGTNMHKWIGNTTDYVIENGKMVVRKPEFGSGGNLFTKKQYDDFVYRFEFKLTPGANNGLGINAPLEGDVAYEGMELQILDNDAPIYENLEEYQYHGSVYGVIAAKRGFLKPVGEWNYQEVVVNGSKIKVILNGTTILDGDMSEARKNGTLDGKDHPGLKREKGHIGFLGHGSEVWFRNIRIKEL